MINKNTNRFAKPVFRSPPRANNSSLEREAGARDQVQISGAVDKGGATSSGLKKLGLGMFAALSLTGTVAGVAGLAAQNLPLCEAESSLMAFQDGGLCVSPEFSMGADGVYRAVRGQVFHRGDAIQDLSSPFNRVLRPAKPRIDLGQDGELTVSTWNLHHGAGQNKDGARDQLDLQIEVLRETNADIDLLQEILPWQAQTLVDKTGKVGYYTQTNPRQGNLILVDPSLEVTENHRMTLNYLVEDRGDAASVVDRTKGHEPRAAQVLKVRGEDTSGREVTVFNTHLSNRGATSEDRQRESETFKTYLEDHIGEDGIFVGGGDLNTREGDGIVKSFRESDYRVEGAKIDWLVSDKVTPVSLQAGDVRTPDGTRISDHPLVAGSYRVSGS